MMKDGSPIPPEALAEMERRQMEVPTGPRPTGEKVPSGLPVIRTMPPWDVICDPTRENPEDQQWYIVRERRARVEVLAALQEQYDQAQDDKTRDELRQAHERVTAAKVRSTQHWYTLFGFDRHHDYPDDVIVSHFYRKRSAAMPEGRYTQFVENTAIHDGEMPYDTLPVIPLQDAGMLGSSVGYSSAWEQLVLQFMMTDLASSTATSIAIHGNPKLVMDRGTEIDADMLANGGEFLLTKPTGADMPQYLVPPSMRNDIKFFFEWVGSKQQRLAKLNDVISGNPGENVSSGTYAALMHSIAIENQNGDEKALRLHREKVADTILGMIKRYADHGMMVEVAGVGQEENLKLLKQDTFGSVARVKMKHVPSAQRSTGMRMEMANMLRENGLLTDPQQLIAFIETGVWEPVTRTIEAALARSQWELEVMKNGTSIEVVQERNALGELEDFEITPEIPVLMTDDPVTHINDAVSVLGSPEAVHNPKVLGPVMAHIMWHIRVWRDLPIDLALALKIPPNPAAMMASETAGNQMKAAAEEKEAKMKADKGGSSPSKTSNGKKETETVSGNETKLPRPASPPA